MSKIRFIRWALIFLMPLSVTGQTKFEIQEFSGIVKAIDPGFKFALERLTLDVNGKEEKFIFNPRYGTLIFDHIKVGDNISLKANVNAKARERAHELSKSNSGRLLSWYFFRDEIIEIKVRDKVFPLPEIKRVDEPLQYKAFLERKVLNELTYKGYQSGLIFENGLIAYNFWLGSIPDLKPAKINDIISFAGTRVHYQEGYKYPIDGVTEVYHYIPLRKEVGKVRSLLFKQNFTCIGAKFDLNDGNTVSVSFPSDQAAKVKEFLKQKEETKIYYHGYKVEGQLHPPELQALVQGMDTLYVGVFGFYGAADGNHDHTEIEFQGKITKVDKTDKGSIVSLIVESEFYVEVNPLMAQQLALELKKGTQIVIGGKERVKKVGEIYQKEYRIITPEKIVINGKEFSLFTQ